MRRSGGRKERRLIPFVGALGRNMTGGGGGGFASELHLLRRRVVLQPKIALDLPKVEIGIFCLHPLRICWEYDPQFLPANIKGGEEMTFILQLKPMTMMRYIHELTICST